MSERKNAIWIARPQEIYTPQKRWSLVVLVEYMLLYVFGLVMISLVFDNMPTQGFLEHGRPWVERTWNLSAALIALRRHWPDAVSLWGLTDPRRLRQHARLILVGVLLSLTISVGYSWLMVSVAAFAAALPEGGVATVGTNELLQRLLLAPVSEEVIYRGLLLGVFVCYARPVVAIAMTSLLFWWGHALPAFLFAEDSLDILADFIYHFDTFLLGIIWGWLQLRSGTIYACMLAHLSVNLCLLIMLPSMVGSFSP